MLLIALHPLNTLVPIVFKFFPNFTVFNLVQPEKALVPILVILLPILTVVIFVLFLNALAAMEVTLYVIPSISTVAGISTVLIFLSVDFEYSTVPFFSPDFVTIYLAFVFVSVKAVPFSGAPVAAIVSVFVVLHKVLES